MKRVRAFFVILWVIIAALISFPLFLICLLIRLGNPVKEQWFAQKYIQGVFKIILFFAGTKLVVKGIENIPKDTPVVFIGNHRSFFDTITTFSVMPNLTGIVAKDDLEKIPVLHRWMATLKCLFLDRHDTRKALKEVLAGIENIKGGTSLVVFPEGTRGISNTEMLPFKDGSFKLATKPGVPIVPMALTNMAEIFEANGGLRLQKVTAIIEFASPIETKGLDRDAQTNLPHKTQNIIQEMLNENVKQV